MNDEPRRRTDALKVEQKLIIPEHEQAILLAVELEDELMQASALLREICDTVYLGTSMSGNETRLHERVDEFLKPS